MLLVRKRRLTTFLVLGLMLVAAGLIAGCGNEETTPEDTGDKQLSGSIIVAGSTSVQPFSEVLAEEFSKTNSDVQIDVQGGGSSQGIQAAVSGAADIGASSRELKPEEKTGLVETTIALDGIAIIVHPSSQIDDLTIDNLRNIYLGNITNWKELGGSDSPITVVCREAGSGTRGAFEELVMNEENISNEVIVQNSTGAVKTTVAGDEKAIGFVSMAALDQDVKNIKIDGVEASVANVKNGSYKISRPFIYITKGEPQGISKAFIDYILSDEGQALIQEEGAISVK